MKKIFVILIVSFLLYGCESTLKNETTNISVDMSLLDFSAQMDIPLKKMNSYFLFESDIDRSLSFEELDISLSKIKEIVNIYNDEKNSYLWSIVLTGMSIVFISLSVIALIISMFKHIHLIEKLKYKKIVKRKTQIKQITATKGITTQGTIAAVTAAIFLHEQSIEEDFKLLLNWRRAKVSNWKASCTMPNTEYYHKGRS